MGEPSRPAGYWLSTWTPVLIWTTLIFYWSSIPGLSTNLGVWDLILRKIAHLVEFGLLAMLLVRAMGRTWIDAPVASQFFWSGVLAGIYAFSDEFHQAFVPGRGPSFVDVGIDFLGIGAGLLLIYTWRTLKMKNENKS